MEGDMTKTVRRECAQLAATWAGCSLMALAAPAFAQAEGQAETAVLQDVIVTAQRRSENLQDVPVAVTAVTPAALENSGTVSLKSLAIIAPNVNVTDSIGFVNSYVRGVGSTNVAPG